MNTRLSGRTASAVLLYALGRWETLLVLLICALGIAGTIVFLGGNIPIIGAWAALGLVGVGGMTVVSLRDQRSIQEALEAPIDLGVLRSQELRGLVKRALDYRAATGLALRRLRSAELRESLTAIVPIVDDPAGLIFNLAQRIEAIRSDRILAADLERLRQLQKRRQLVPADAEHLDGLQRVFGLVADAEQTINDTLAELGASYAAIQGMGASGEIRGGPAQRGLASVRERSKQLREIAGALDEAYHPDPV